MDSKIKILIGVLVTGIILVCGVLIWNIQEISVSAINQCENLKSRIYQSSNFACNYDEDCVLVEGGCDLGVLTVNKNKKEKN